MRSRISQAARKRWALLRSNTSTGLRWLGKVAAKEGVKLYLVGGVVRDKLLGKKTLDIDLACEGNVKRLGERLAGELEARFIYYPEFMTGTIEGPNCERIDIARTRKESYPKQGKLPEVEPAPIEEDLYRRDFTVNAMARSLAPGEFGKLIDPLNGRQDLKKKVIRVIHDASFTDDPTRIFRAVRYGERLGARIDSHTAELMMKAIDRIPQLSGERLLYEFRSIAKEQGKVRLRIVKKLNSMDALGLGLPLRPLSFTLMEKLPDEEPCWFLCLLLSFLAEPRLQKLPLSKHSMETIRTLRKRNEIRSKLTKLKKPSQITFYLREFDERGLKIITAIQSNEAARKIKLYLDRYKDIRIATTGEDIKRLGIAEGPRYTRLLYELLRAKLDGAIRTKREEKALLKLLLKGN